MPPRRRSRVGERLAEYGLTYDPDTKTARLPGPGGREFSYRQVMKIRDLPAPFEASGDADILRLFARSHRGEHFTPDDLLADRRLRAAITVVRWDAAQPGTRRTEDEARLYVWAWARILGRRQSDWTRYRTRVPLAEAA